VLTNPIHDRTVSLASYLGRGVRGKGRNEIDSNGDRRINEISNRLMRRATGGLCGFNRNGELVLSVDPAKYAGMSPGVGYE